MQQCARSILEDDLVVAAAAAQRLLLQCNAGRWKEVVRGLDTQVLCRLVDLSVEGDEACFVFVALLAYAACDDYIRECLLDADLGVRCVDICSGLLRTHDHIIIHETLKLLAALSVRACNRHRVSRLLSAHPKVVVCLVQQCEGDDELPDLPRALEVLAVYVSTREGCLAAQPAAPRVLDMLATLPRRQDLQRVAKRIRGELKMSAYY